MIGVVPELPVFGGDAPKERADAARNRLRILEAAAGLVDEHGIEQVSMEAVACRAGVGTGTLYRRFGDRTGLVLALLDEHTREFQDALIGGPPPLGPGATAAERLRAFGDGYLDLMETHADLLVAATRSDVDGRGPLSFYATHLGILLREACPHLDPAYTAWSLLATLSPGAFVMQRRALGWPMERLRFGWYGLVDALSASRA